MFKALAICCLLAVVAADVSEISNEYLPPVQGGGAVGSHSGGGAVGGGFISGVGEPNREYLAPVGGDAAPAHSYSEDEGYRYRAAKRRVFRNRRVYRQRRRY